MQTIVHQCPNRSPPPKLQKRVPPVVQARFIRGGYYLNRQWYLWFDRNRAPGSDKSFKQIITSPSVGWYNHQGGCWRLSNVISFHFLSFFRVVQAPKGLVKDIRNWQGICVPRLPGGWFSTQLRPDLNVCLGNFRSRREPRRPLAQCLGCRQSGVFALNGNSTIICGNTINLFTSIFKINNFVNNQPPA